MNFLYSLGIYTMRERQVSKTVIIRRSKVTINTSLPASAYQKNCSQKASDLDVIAARIRDRDKVVADGVRSNWLPSGLDLNEAKQALGHGKFEAWCSAELSYRKSKAEKLMRAEEMFGPLLKSVTMMDLPPLTVAYNLSAPSTRKRS